jgi:hypothetical protein
VEYPKSKLVDSDGNLFLKFGKIHKTCNVKMEMWSSSQVWYKFYVAPILYLIKENMKTKEISSLISKGKV